MVTSHKPFRLGTLGSCDIKNPSATCDLCRHLVVRMCHCRWSDKSRRPRCSFIEMFLSVTVQAGGKGVTQYTDINTTHAHFCEYLHTVFGTKSCRNYAGRRRM